MDVSVVHLRSFLALARTGSVTAAAKHLCYSQPTVSVHLRKLQAATGSQLFTWPGRCPVLTPAGRALVALGPAVLDAVHQAGTAMAGFDGAGQPRSPGPVRPVRSPPRACAAVRHDRRVRPVRSTHHRPEIMTKRNNRLQPVDGADGTGQCRSCHRSWRARRPRKLDMAHQKMKVRIAATLVGVTAMTGVGVSVANAATYYFSGTVPAYGSATYTGSTFYTTTQFRDINFAYSKNPYISEVKPVKCSNLADTSGYKVIGANDHGEKVIASNVLDGTCYHVNIASDPAVRWDFSARVRS